jgi:hypothetical protein
MKRSSLISLVMVMVAAAGIGASARAPANACRQSALHEPPRHCGGWRRGGDLDPTLLVTRAPSAGPGATPAAAAATRRRGFNSIGRTPSGAG